MWLPAPETVLLVTASFLGFRDVKDKREVLSFFNSRKLWGGGIAQSRCVWHVFLHDAMVTAIERRDVGRVNALAQEVQAMEQIGNCTAAISKERTYLRSYDDMVRHVLGSLATTTTAEGRMWTEEYVLFVLPSAAFLADPLPVIARSFPAAGVPPQPPRPLRPLLMAKVGSLRLADGTYEPPQCGFNLLFLSKSLVPRVLGNGTAAAPTPVCDGLVRLLPAVHPPGHGGEEPDASVVMFATVPQTLEYDPLFDVKQQRQLLESDDDDGDDAALPVVDASAVAILHLTSATGLEIDVVNFPHPSSPDQLAFNCRFYAFGPWDTPAYVAHPVVQRWLAYLQVRTFSLPCAQNLFYDG